MQKRYILSNLKQYKITLTTSYETYHGISGHLFEMIEYFYYLTFYKNILTSILISDGLTEEIFWQIINEKYNFTDSELLIYKKNTFFHFQPKAIIADTLFVVDGSLRMKDASLMTSNIFMFRCNEECSLNENVTIFQDYDVYEPLKNSINYKKKILIDKYNNINETSNNIAMFYATSNSRKLTGEEIQEIIQDYSQFDEFLILSDKYFEVPDKCKIELVPIKNLWESFSTYIYTNASSLIDCSPRFIVECKHYNKNVLYHKRGKIDIGLETRIKDMQTDIVFLKETDEFYSKIECAWNQA